MPLFLRLAFSFACLAGLGLLLFVAAGRTDLPWFWAYMAAMGLGGFARSVAIDPDLARERLRPGAGGKDFLTIYVLALLLFAQLGLAGADVGRFHWTDTVPPALQALGVGLVAAGGVFIAWAMGINRYFSSVVRWQGDRGHRLIDTGPYAMVRHPGYAGGVWMLVGTSLSLGSWISLVPCLLAILSLVRRVRVEEGLLCASLPGYSDYAGRVGYRFFPGLW